MDADISDWLKNTVPGIIVLGAIGSIVAVAILHKLSALHDRFEPHLALGLGRFVVWWLGIPMRQLAPFALKPQPYRIIAFFAFELGKLLVLPWILVVALVILNRLTNGPVIQHPFWAGIAACAAFLCGYALCVSLGRLWYHRMATSEAGWDLYRDAIGAAGNAARQHPAGDDASSPMEK